MDDNALKKLERKVKRYLPFTASSMVWYFVNKKATNCKSLVDIGCASGEAAHDLVPSNWYKVGLEIDANEVKKGKRKRNLDEFILGDANNLPFNSKSFDVVLCCEVIEHLPKKHGFLLISQLEKIAIHFVVFRTPNGKFRQDFPVQPYMSHLSEWYLNDVTSRGYSVRGNTLRFIWDQDGPAKKIPSITPFFNILNILFGPIVLFYLPLAGDFMCTKRIH